MHLALATAGTSEDPNSSQRSSPHRSPPPATPLAIHQNDLASYTPYPYLDATSHTSKHCTSPHTTDALWPLNLD